VERTETVAPFIELPAPVEDGAVVEGFEDDPPSSSAPPPPIHPASDAIPPDDPVAITARRSVLRFITDHNIATGDNRFPDFVRTLSKLHRRQVVSVMGDLNE
jgi:hypothetical protein